MDIKTFLGIFLGIIVGVIILMLLTVALSGCAANPIPEVLPDTPARVLTKFIFAPDLFFTLTIVGIMAGVFAFLNGQKIGIPLIIACFAGMCMKLAVVRFGFWIGLFGAIGSLVSLVYTIAVKDKALKEIISGVQDFKGYDVYTDDLNDRLKRNQTKSTEKLVKKVKRTL